MNGGSLRCPRSSLFIPLLPLIKRHKRKIHGARIIGFGANQAIVIRLLQDMSCPTGHATDGKGRRKEITG
jgi:hypothetical protein